MGAQKDTTRFCKLVSQTVALWVVSTLHNKLRSAAENEPMLSEEQLQKQLTVVSVIYHLIGIFYNE